MQLPRRKHLHPVALNLSADDLVKYCRGVFHSEHFPPALREMLLHTTFVTGGEPIMYALGGLIVSDFEGRRKISHAGDIWGYTSNLAYYSEEDLTIVMLANRQVDAPALSSFEAQIARVIFGIPQPEIRDLALGEEVLDRYTGDFRLHPYIGGSDKYGFIADGGKLFIRFGGIEAEEPMIPLLAQGNNMFRAIFDDEWIFQFLLEHDNDKAIRLISGYRDGTFTAFREN